MSEVRVTGLNVYPIKSCGGIELDSARVMNTGLEYDRMFMLVDEKDRFISQRTKEVGPMLTQVQPEFGTYKGDIVGGKFNGRLGVSIENHGDIELSLFLPPHHRDDDVLRPGAKRKKMDIVNATLHESKVTGAVVSTEANNFFSDYLGKPVRLLRLVKSIPRPISEKRHVAGASNVTGFADAYSILLTNQKSLDELNQHSPIADIYEEGIPMDRLRPNIVVDGEGLEAYDEDYWRKVRIGNMIAYIVKPCARCQIPDIDQTTGEVRKVVLKTLQSTRKGQERGGDTKGTFFGQNLNHVSKIGGQVAVGDLVTIEERADEPNVVIA
jgi:uncharacterized protein YcbX